MSAPAFDDLCSASPVEPASGSFATSSASPFPSTSPVVVSVSSASASSAASMSPSAPHVHHHHRPHDHLSLAHKGVSLLNENKFNEAKAMFAAHSNHDIKIALLGCYMSFIQAASSHAETELHSTLAAVWALEKRASGQKTVEGKLIQADTHFLGSLVQIISQKYVKAAWNLRKSYNFYAAAQKDLQTYNGADRAELQGWSDFGNGFFSVVMSFLPPTVLKVASFAGYSGDKELGLQLLHRSQQSSSFMAPFSCLLLLTYYNSIASFTGEPEDTYQKVSDELFEWSDKYYPDGVLFLLQKSRSWRCKRNLEQAIIVAKRAILNCKELPSVAVLFHFNTGFCSFFLLDFQQSAHYFDQLLHETPGGAYTPPPGQPKHSPQEVALMKQEEADGLVVRMPPAKASALTFYALLTGVNYMLLGNPHRARWYYSLVAGLADKKSTKPIDLYAQRKSAEFLARNNGDRKEDALLDANELIFIWNGSSQMPESALKQMIQMLDQADKLNLPHWKIEQKAAVALYRANMYKGLNDAKSALEQMQFFLVHEKALKSSSKAKLDGTLAFGYYLQAFLLNLVDQVPQSEAFLKQAQAQSGFDQYNALQVRCHALAQMIKRKKAELGIK